MRRLLAVAVAVLLVLPSSAAAASVTTSPIIQRDLGLAVAYWQKERPELSTQCPMVEVEVAPMEVGEGAPGSLYPGSDAWAQTFIGSCVIKIAPAMWAAMNEPPWIVESLPGYTVEWAPTGPYEACVDMIHEYGHILGLPDTNGPGMMEYEDWDRGPSPCEAAYPKITKNPNQPIHKPHHRKRAKGLGRKSGARPHLMR